MKKKIRLYGRENGLNNREKKLRNYTEKDGSYVSESRYVANRYGFISTRAHYYTEDVDGLMDGNSKYMLITNKSVRRGFNNAIFNGAIKFLNKHSKKSVGYNIHEDESWNYKLISWRIVYRSPQKFYIYHEDHTNKTLTFTGSRKVRKDSKIYQNDNFNPKRQKGAIYKRRNNIIKKTMADEDMYLTPAEYERYKR
jgi:hypothetical protein